MRLMASSHPSGVVRIQEMRLRFPLSSLAWQLAHFEMVTASVTGMPSSVICGEAAPPRPPPRPPPLPCAKAAGAQKSAAAAAAIAARFLMALFLSSFAGTRIRSPNCRSERNSPGQLELAQAEPLSRSVSY